MRDKATCVRMEECKCLSLWEAMIGDETYVVQMRQTRKECRRQEEAADKWGNGCRK